MFTLKRTAAGRRFRDPLPSEDPAVQRFEVPGPDTGRRTGEPLARQREETAPVVHLDAYGGSRAAALGQLASHHDLDAPSRRADLRVALQVSENDARHPQKLARLWVETVVEVYPGVGIVSGERVA